LQQHGQTFESLNTKIAVVTFEATPFARHYVAQTGLAWPLLVDEARELYRAYGMLSGRIRDIWGPRTMWAYLKELARGKLPRARRADTLQLGGDVLIDPAGIVRLHHVGSGPGDRPSVSRLLSVRMAASGTEGRA